MRYLSILEHPFSGVKRRKCMLCAIIRWPFPLFSEPVIISFQAARICMAVHVFLFLLVCFLILSFAPPRRLACLHLQASSSQAGSRRTMVHRLLKPRTPLDCPLCRLCSSEKNSFGASLHEEVSGPDCLMTKGQSELGLERARRILHHVQWQHHSLNWLLTAPDGSNGSRVGGHTTPR